MEGYQFIDSIKHLDKIDTSYDYTFVVINYEQARIHINKLIKYAWHFVILDESHRIKNRRAKTAKAIWKLSYAMYKLILSGTPTTKDEIDLWSQFKFLNSNLWGSNFERFKDQALKEIDLGDFKKLRVHKRKIKPFMKKAQYFTYQLKLDDMTDMPGKRDVPILLDMTGAQRKAYIELEEGFLTEHKGKRSSIDLSVTSLIRLQQLAGGHLILENGDSVRFKEQPKLWWILDKLEDIGSEKLMIVCRFTHEIELIAAALKKLKYDYEIMQGGMKPPEIKRVRKSFQNNKGCQILIGQVSVIKEGNNFQHCCRYGVFYSKSISYVDIEQCKKRLWRNGQTRKVIYYHLIMRNTIDERIETIVEKRYANAENVLLRLMLKRNHNMAKVEKKATKEKVTEKKVTKGTTEKKAAKKASNLPKFEAPEFGVEKVAKGLGVDARTARLKLRNAGVEKSGRNYDFKNQAGVDKVVKQLSKEKKSAE